MNGKGSQLLKSQHAIWVGVLVVFLLFVLASSLVAYLITEDKSLVIAGEEWGFTSNLSEDSKYLKEKAVMIAELEALKEQVNLLSNKVAEIEPLKKQGKNKGQKGDIGPRGPKGSPGKSISLKEIETIINRKIADAVLGEKSENKKSLLSNIAVSMNEFVIEGRSSVTFFEDRLILAVSGNPYDKCTVRVIIPGVQDNNSHLDIGQITEIKGLKDSELSLMLTQVKRGSCYFKFI